MKKLSTLLLSFLLISTISYAQIGDTIIKHDKGIVHKFTGKNYFPFMFYDYDNPDNNWIALSLWKNEIEHTLDIYKVDNNLNIIDSIKTSLNNLSLKYNNKLYGVCMSELKNVNKFSYFDTITFYCTDTDANLLTRKILSTYDSDTLKFGFALSPKVFFTKDKNVGIFKKDYRNWSNIQAKLIIYDTLGNTINSKVYNIEGLYSDADIIETDNNFELLCNYSNVDRDSADTKIMILDKNTLEITDSIIGFDSIIRPNNLYNINDSIFISVGLYEMVYNGTQIKCDIKVKIVNRYSLEDKSIKFTLNYLNSVESDNYYPEFSKRLDYINTDSIYFVLFSPDTKAVGGVVQPSTSNSNIIKILNFNINGNLNYEYDFDYDSTVWKQINGIKATNDGGLIITYVELFSGNSYFIKFMPYGLVSLSNVESGEKASLRVYPNPAKDFVFVDIEADKFDKADIEIYDLGGRMVKRSKLMAKVGNRIDVSSLKAGVYSYRVALNGKGVSGKIVIGE